MNRKKIILEIGFLILLLIGTIIILNRQPPFRTDDGMIFGTMYQITYQSNKELKNQIEEELKKVDFSLSPFNKKSVITKVNQNQDVPLDTMFTHVFNLAQKVSQNTNGAFDITVAPLVNAWGFGFKHDITPDSTAIDSLKTFIGYKKVRLENGKVIKDDPRIMLDCSAIAKGYGVDIVAGFLDSKGIQNYMVNIGGEIVVKGKNPKMNNWHIGINKPEEDSLSISQDIETVLSLTNKGMATSGNYRNFYYKGGKRYAHTIDPRSGYPVQHSILSATVLANDCATADAYATSFMVMGLDSAMNFCREHPEIDAYFICAGEGEKFDLQYTEGMSRYLVKKKY
ncbi:FAD:protein FMN transferase [Phocaeicola oris]|uniref:FAD:protein FMN transferase n=1 Tax=Phocaeicola oris TaxID=2896850 RepID=UPI00234EA316|nr:FAD:protein FMN transferase [Phocaeicola oris]MCE2615659.1 FAD:protein FMN transferase [Phocaeicola oris]